jgi:shikimate kinase
MDNIILTGFMATGKTVVAKQLAERLGYKFVDTDLQIERYAKKSIADIFAQDGEAEFRRLEKLLLHWLIHYDRAVISSGGGMIATPHNLKELRKMGKIICLTATPEIIFERIKNETHRPLLQTPNPAESIKKLLAKRETCYAKADYTIDTTTLTTEQVVDRIIKWLDNFK